jgi:UDP-4-amino-4-deoxy-L-arabinose formyltransferase/UDP-glucuronic acid dehydrogenase (UDP-4-keto-hexauronic acid decarboxylating)
MNLYILSTTTAGLEIIDAIRTSIPIQGVIGLSDRPPDDSLSGYVYLEPHCRQRGLRFISVENYDLAGQEHLKKISIDVLLVLGWQRLVPRWLIEQCSIGAYGAHGSPYGITRGRGRSPQNWAILLEEKSFEVSLFQIDAQTDSGPVLDSREFPLTPEDDIPSSYRKSNTLIADMIRANFVGAPRTPVPQTGTPQYFPQRLPEDGEIDWNRPATAVCSFIRALTRPYPGAFSRLGSGGKMIIWKAVPSSGRLEPGEISGQLVGTRDVPIQILDSVTEPKGVTVPTVLPSVDFVSQLQAIIDRHRRKHPDQPVVEKILRMAGRKS